MDERSIPGRWSIPTRRRAVVAAISIAAALLTAVAILAAGRTIVDGQIVAEAPAPPIEGGLTLAQTFRVEVEGLAAIDLQLANYARTADGTVEVALRDTAPGDAIPRDRGHRPLAVWRLDAARVVDNAWHRFHLAAPLVGSEGRMLAITLSRPQSDGRPITAWTTAGDVYPPGALAIDGRPTGSDLAFRAIYRPGWRAGTRHVLASGPFPPAATAGLIFGLLASALGLVYILGASSATP